MRIANERSMHGLLHDVEQHYECSNRWDGCAFAQATSALDAETDLSIRLPTCTFNEFHESGMCFLIFAGAFGYSSPVLFHISELTELILKRSSDLTSFTRSSRLRTEFRHCSSVKFVQSAPKTSMESPKSSGWFLGSMLIFQVYIRIQNISKDSTHHKDHYPPVNQHSNGKSTIWRCISYWRRWISIAMLVYWRVYL